MAKFLTGNALNLELENIFNDANESLVLISPYIKLHPRFISALKTKLDNHNLEIIVVFGKNEDKSRSMTGQDFEFLKSLPNIRIFFELHLHAKYYANESCAILSSMNLYDYSQNNNIETGVLTKTNVTGDDGLDGAAATYFDKVIEQAELLFDKEPQYESVLLGLSKKYVKSIVQEDKLSDFFSNKLHNRPPKGQINPPVVANVGYCIRTGIQIPFDKNNPFCREAFENWNRFKNKDYTEKFCHFSGEASNGLTSFSKPILRKNWVKAKQFHNL